MQTLTYFRRAMAPMVYLFMFLAIIPMAYAGEPVPDAGEAGKAATGPALVLGVHPYLPAPEILSRFMPLADYLTEKLGRMVIVEVSEDYETHIDDTGLGRIDISFMGPAAYVRMTEQFGKKRIFASIENQGHSTFRGVIIVSENSMIMSLSELMGKSFAFGSPNSTMSHIVPRYMLLRSGVDVATLSRYEFLSNHENVALGVLFGDFDAGAVKKEVYDQYHMRGLKALAWSPPIGEHVFVASDRLPDQLARKIRRVLLELSSDPEGREVLFFIKDGVTGLVPASDHDYDNLREMIRTLEGTGAFR